MTHLRDPPSTHSLQAAARTNDTAGDGTTTATVLSAAFIAEGMKIVSSGTNPVQLVRAWLQRGGEWEGDKVGRCFWAWSGKRVEQHSSTEEAVQQRWCTQGAGLDEHPQIDAPEAALSRCLRTMTHSLLVLTDPMAQVRGMEKTVAHLVQELAKISIPIRTNKDLDSVASVSAGGK